MKKGLFALFIVGALLLSGCGTDADTSNNDTQDTPNNQTDTNDTDTNNTESEVTETVIYEQNGLKIFFKDITAAPEPLIGCYINLRIENTSDTDYMIQTQDVSANDIMIPFGNVIFSCDVLAGKTANTYIWISNTEQLGVEMPVTKAEFKFVVYECEDITNGLVSDNISVSE